MDHTEISTVFDNEAVHDICKNQLKLKGATYHNMNRLITKVVSSITSTLRFEGEINYDVNQYQLNLVPFPRLHFMISSMSPVLNKNRVDSHWSIRDITN